MLQYPDCPFCGNSYNTLSIVDVKIGGLRLKGIKCGNPECEKLLGVFKDYDEKLKEIKDSVEELESKIDD